MRQIKRLASGLSAGKASMAAIFFLLLAVRGYGAGPKYIFLMIGDGLGTPQRAAAEKYHRLKTESPNSKLLMNKLPVRGLTKTLNAKGAVTDSAAAATALAAGVKTDNGVIGLEPDLKSAPDLVSKEAKKRGMAVAVISSVPINHATPAAFYSRAASRKDYIAIATQMPDDGFDCFIGQKFLRDDDPRSTAGVYDKMRRNGYKTVATTEGFRKLTADDMPVLVEAKFPYAIERTAKDLTLAEAVAKSIELLKNDEQGFFMMVESGKIDWCGHANDIAGNIKETLAFDKAVKTAHDFYLKHPDDTLIIVTGDHECGGLRTAFTGNFDARNFVELISRQNMSAGSLQKKAESLMRDGENAAAMIDQMAACLGIAPLTPEERGELIKIVKESTNIKNEAAAEKYGANPIACALLNITAKRCGMAWASRDHTAQPVITTAVGSESKRFGGQYENTEICRRLLEIIKDGDKDQAAGKSEDDG